MKLISKAAFARTISVSAPYVDKLCKSGKLTLRLDGKKQKVDLHGSLTLKYIAGREESGKVQTQPEEPTQSPKTTPTFIPGGNNPSGTGNSTSDPETQNKKERNLELKNEELEIKISQTRGDLVRKKLSVNIFSQIYNIHENQFKSISVKTNPKTETVYTSEYQDKATEILEALGLVGKKEAKKEILKILNIGESERFRRLTEIMEDETMAILKNIQFEIDRYLRLSEVK